MVNGMIKLDAISEEARGILVKAIPHQANGVSSADREYFNLYQDFQKATNHKYTGDGSFNQFQCAVLAMKRRQKTLNYKADWYAELTKGRVL